MWSHFRRSVLHRVWALEERKFGCNMDLIWCSTRASVLTASAVSQLCKLTYTIVSYGLVLKNILLVL